MTTRSAAGVTLVVHVDPIEIALRSRERILYFFDATPETLIAWHNEWGFPIRWEGSGRGRKGRKGYVPVRQAKLALQQRLTKAVAS